MEEAPEPEPAIAASQELEPTATEEEAEPATTLGRWRSWLNKKLGDIISEEE